MFKRKSMRRRRRKQKGGNRWTHTIRRTAIPATVGVATGAATTYAVRKNLPNIMLPTTIPMFRSSTVPTSTVPTNTKFTNIDYTNFYNELTKAYIDANRSIITSYNKERDFDKLTHRQKVDGKIPDILQLLVLTLDDPKNFFENILNYPVTIDRLPRNEILIDMCEVLIRNLENYSNTHVKNWILSNLLKLIPSFFVTKYATMQLPTFIDEAIVSKWIKEIQKQDDRKLRLKIIEIAKAYLQKHKPAVAELR